MERLRPNKVNYHSIVNKKNEHLEISLAAEPPEEENAAFSFVSISADSIGDARSFELSVSAVLRFCKKKVLLPYSRLFSLLGWRPIFEENRQTGDSNCCLKFINRLYIMFVIALIVFGYILEFAACFRRDGFSPYQQELVEVSVPSQTHRSILDWWLDLFQHNSGANSTSGEMESQIEKTCSGGLFSMYLFPDLLHFLSYVCMIYQMRFADHEQLETLMERVFLQSSASQSWHFAQRRLIRRLRMVLFLGFCWLFVSLASQILQLFDEDELDRYFTWMHPNSVALRIVLESMLIATTTLNDSICIAIATSYCFHCQLIISYLQNLCDSIMIKNIGFRQFYKEIQEARKFLKYLNNEQAIGISLLSLNFGCKITTGFYGMISGQSNTTKNWYIFSSTIIIILFWLVLLLLPILQAVRLTEVCSIVKKLGHEIRSRPFGYQDTPQADLDSFLLFTGTLNINARIFRIPVRSSCLLLAFIGIIFAMVILGQLGLTHFGSF